MSVFQRIKRLLYSVKLESYRLLFPFKDFVSCCFNPRLFGLHRKLYGHLRAQKKNWTKYYTGNYFYQGLRKIGIRGVKPTEDRIIQYGIIDLFNSGQSVLDIGSNCGFLALHLAPLVSSIDGVELNPYLNGIAEDSRDFLGIDNARFFTEDFTTFNLDRKYDVILSLSNHHTIDGKLDMGFENYIAKIFNCLNPDGLLLFESHNVLGNSKTGNPGDDTDLDDKFDIAEKYFKVEKHKMVKKYTRMDVDKLFVVMRRRSDYDPTAIRTMILSDAIQKYSY